MHKSKILSAFSIWSTLFLLISCLPNSRSDLSIRDNAALTLGKTNDINSIEDTLIPYENPPSTPNPYTNSLSTRSTNTTETSIQGRKGHITYLDFSFLIWSDAHTALLETMINDFRTAALDFANKLVVGAKYGTMVLTYGAFVLTIYYVDKEYLIDAIIEVFMEVLQAMYPLTYSLVWNGVVMFLFWLDM